MQYALHSPCFKGLEQLQIAPRRHVAQTQHFSVSICSTTKNKTSLQTNFQKNKTVANLGKGQGGGRYLVWKH